MKVDKSFDYRGLICPQPVANLTRELRNAESGEIIEVMADDPAFENDVMIWTTATNCEIIDVIHEVPVTKIYLRVV